MGTVFKKVDRVRSVQEAIALQSLGVDFIGVSLNGNSWFTDNRCIAKEVAVTIRKALVKSKLVGEFAVDDNLPEILLLIDEVGLDYIQVIFRTPLSAQFRAELKHRGVGIIYAGICASPDDDPSWILDDYTDHSSSDISFFQIDIFGDMKNSWRFFKEESPSFPDGFQISDIEEIGRKVPLIITLDYTVDNVFEILGKIPDIKGICMTIAEGTTRNDIHYFSYAAVLEIAEKISSMQKDIL